MGLDKPGDASPKPAAAISAERDSPRILVDLSVAAFGGAGTYVAGFAQGLAQGGVPDRSAIVVLVSTTWADANRESVSRLRDCGITVDAVRVAAPGTWKARMTRGRLIGREVRLRQCAVAFVPRDTAPRISVPYVMLAQNRYAWERYLSSSAVGGTLPAMLLRFAARQSARRAGSVLAVSGAFARSMPRGVQVAGVVHQGCSMREQDRPGPGPRPGDLLKVAMICNVIPNKRIEVVIEGVARSSAGGHKRILRVYGCEPDFRYARRLRAQAEARLGREVFCGPAMGEALVDVYRDAHVVAVGGTFETFCFPLVEGMRSGCVIVAPEGPLVEEICGDVAITYPEGDPLSLAQALDVAALEWAERSRRGVERARAFTWARTVERTIEHVRTSARPARLRPR